jgi:hypothetical protein
MVRRQRISSTSSTSSSSLRFTRPSRIYSACSHPFGFVSFRDLDVIGSFDKGLIVRLLL